MNLWALFGLVVVVGVILAYARKSGSDATKTKILMNNEKAQERITDAISNAPSSKSELVDRLREPGGKL